MNFPEQYMFKLNLGSLAFYIFAVVTAGMFIVELTNPNHSADSAIAQLVLALTGSVAIVPVHERIHAVTYKAIGAPKVRFIAEWRMWLRREMRSLVMMTTDCASVISTRNGQARLSAHRTHRQISDNRRRDHRHRRQPAVRNC